MRIAAILLPVCLLAAAGCQNPRSSVTIPVTAPQVRVLNAPQGAQIFVDGQSQGAAARFNGQPEVLQVEAGTHVVEIRLGDQILYSQKLFFGPQEMRTVSL